MGVVTTVNQMPQKVDRDSRPLHRNQRRGQNAGKVSELWLQPTQLLGKLLGMSCHASRVCRNRPIVNCMQRLPLASGF